MAETDTNAYDNAFTDFHALPFALRSSAHAGHATAKVSPFPAMGGQATASFVKSRRINSAPILLAFVVCIDDYVNSGLLHKTICSFLRTIPLCTATTLQRLLRQRQVATSPRGQRAVLRFSSGSLYSWGGVLALGSALGFRLSTWSMWVSMYHNSFNNFSFD